MDVTVTKVWDDNSNSAGKRPTSVTLQVKNGDNVVASEAVTEEDLVDGDVNRWSHIFSVPKYNANAQEINYTADELDTGSIFYTSANKVISGNMSSGYTITNKFVVPDDKISIPVTKVWDDNNNIAGKRPVSVTLQVKNGNSVIVSKTVTEADAVDGDTNSWNYTFTVPKYDENGDEINYTADEADIESIFYTSDNTVIDGNMTSGFTITNKFKVPNDTIEIPVTKIWNDNNNEAKKRPESVTIQVKDGDRVVANKVADEDNKWSVEFTLPKYDNLGNEINYTVDEADLENMFYTSANKAIDGDMTNGYTITNTFEVPNDKVSVNVTKTWVDTPEQQDKRPAGVTIVLKNGEQEAGRQDFNNTNGWSYTFNNLPKYDRLGNLINYTVEEVTTNKFYTSNTTGDMNTEYTVTNTFKVPNETVDITVNKVWVDNNNEAGKRPSSVTLKVTGNGETYTQVVSSKGADSNTWSYTFKGLPKYDVNGNEIEYSVDEEKLTSNSEFYLKTVNQDTDTVTNTFNVPQDTVTIKATKEWNDNNNFAKKRPDSVTLQVKDGDRVVTSEVANSENNWTVDFTVPKYNSLGQEINYTVDEADLGSIFYTVGNKSISGDMTNGYKVTNTFEVPDEKVEVPVTKVWNDNSNKAGKRPQNVTVKLTGSDGQEYEYQMSKGNEVSGDTNTWKYTFTNLPKYDEKGNLVTYTLSEEATGSIFYTEQNTVVDQERKTVTNTFEVPDDKIEIPATKVWDDNNNSAGKRPSSVTLTLTGTGADVNISKEQKLTISDAVEGNDNSWSYTFTGLPKYDANGDEVVYTIDEQDLNNIFYTRGNTIVSQENRTVTNKFVVPDEKISVPVTKVWDDNSNSAGKRPSSVTLVLQGNGQTYKQELTSGVNADSSNSNNWKYTFDNLPKYDANGDEINYVLSEELDNIYYTSENSKVEQATKTITNKFEVPDDKISIPVTKVWDDNNNSAGKRPNNVVFVLTGNDANDKNNPYKYTLTEANADLEDSNEWKYTFTNLPKYNSVNGDEITYTLSEELDNIYYTKENSNVNQEAKTITNTFKVPTDTIDVPVVKVWADNGNVANKRPASVDFVLNGSDGSGPYRHTLTIDNVDISDSNRWNYTFINLPKYNSVNGDEITYTLTEENVNSDFYVASVDQGNKTVTNTFSIPDEKIQVTAKKYWDDNSNANNRRPTSVVLTLTGTF